MVMTVTPVQQPDLEEIGCFLHDHLAQRISAQAWVTSLSHAWAAAQPNFGMQLRDDGRLVGVFCAVYSDQQIDGKTERFCNPHSWCVLEAYRHASVSLVLPLLKQRGYHFTMFTPNPKVAQVFLGLRFRLLDERLLFVANLPAPWPSAPGCFVEHRTGHISARLHGAALSEFDAHRQIPWLKFVAFGIPGDECLVIYKPERWKRMACASILHVSDPGAMDRHGHRLRHHLLLHGRMPVLRVEARFLLRPPRLSFCIRRQQPKLVSSATLSDSKIRNVYSEMMALDI